jgi:hypothetical protein
VRYQVVDVDRRGIINGVPYLSNGFSNSPVFPTPDPTTVLRAIAESRDRLFVDFVIGCCNLFDVP